MTTKNKALILLVSERMIRLFIGFFIHAWIARNFSPEDFGFINFVVKCVFVYYAFGLLGTDEILMAEMVNKDLSIQRNVLKTTFVIRLFFGVFGWILMSILSGISSGFLSETWIWIVIYGCTIPLQAFAVYEVPLILNMKMEKIFWGRNFSYSTGVLAKSGGLILKIQKGFFLYGYACEEFCYKLITAIFAYKIGYLGGKYDKNIAIKIFKPSLIVFFAVFLALFDQRLPFLFLEHFSNSKVVGQYSVMVSLLDIALLIPVSIATVLFPAVVKEMGKDKVQYGQHRLSLSRWLVLSSIFCSIAGYLITPIGMDLLYKGKYNEVAPIFQVFIFTLVFYFFNIGRFKWFILEGYLKDWVTLLLTGILIQGISLYVLIPRYGLRGVVISVLAGQILPNVFLIWRRSVKESLIVFLESFNIFKK